jgi:hypothetical protein
VHTYRKRRKKRGKQEKRIKEVKRNAGTGWKVGKEGKKKGKNGMLVIINKRHQHQVIFFYFSELLTKDNGTVAEILIKPASQSGNIKPPVQQ